MPKPLQPSYPELQPWFGLHWSEGIALLHLTPCEPVLALQSARPPTVKFHSHKPSDSRSKATMNDPDSACGIRALEVSVGGWTRAGKEAVPRTVGQLSVYPTTSVVCDLPVCGDSREGVV